MSKKSFNFHCGFSLAALSLFCTGFGFPLQAQFEFSSGEFKDNSVLSLVGSPTQVVYSLAWCKEKLMTENRYSFPHMNSERSEYLVYEPESSSPRVWTGMLKGNVTSGDTAFDDVINHALLPLGATLVLQKFIPGTVYQILFLLVDVRPEMGERQFAVSCEGAKSEFQNYAFEGGQPSLGGYVLLKFTAKTTQLKVQILTNRMPQVNAIVVAKVDAK